MIELILRELKHRITNQRVLQVDGVVDLVGAEGQQTLCRTFNHCCRLCQILHGGGEEVFVSSAGVVDELMCGCGKSLLMSAVLLCGGGDGVGVVLLLLGDWFPRDVLEVVCKSINCLQLLCSPCVDRVVVVVVVIFVLLFLFCFWWLFLLSFLLLLGLVLGDVLDNAHGVGWC